MGEGRSEKGGVVHRPRSRDQEVPDPTKREFLKLIGGGLVVGAGLAALKPLIEKPRWMRAADAMVKMGEPQKPIGQKKETLSNFEEKVFHNLDSSQRQEADRRLSEAESEMNSSKAIENLKTYENQIFEAAQKADISPELFLGLIFAESKGDPTAVSRIGALGLTQVMDEMALSWEKRGFALEDRLNTQKTLAFSAEELRKYYDEFQDWGLAFWAWHVGEPTVYFAVWTYFMDKGIDLGDINIPDLGDTSEANDEEFRRVQAIKKRYQDAITGSGISVYHLLTNFAVQQMFVEGDWDDTEKYCYRIVAGAKIYENSSNQELRE